MFYRSVFGFHGETICKLLHAKQLGYCCSKIYLCPPKTFGIPYTAIQLVNGKDPSNKKNLPAGFMELFNDFKMQYQSFAHTKILLPVVIQCITEACMEIPTSYANAIVEIFEKRLIYFLVYKLQILFVVS